MVLSLPFTSATAAATAKGAANIAFTNLPALALRGGGLVEGFDKGMVSNRLAGLAYSTITTLMIGSGLSLFGSAPKSLEPIPDDPEKAKEVKLNNAIKLTFSICMSASIALALYTTTVFALISIYSNTALGFGLQSEYLEFFDSCGAYRLYGFWSFVGTLVTYNIGFVLNMILKFEAPLRWIIPVPAILVGTVGMYQYKSIMNLASKLIYSSPK